MKQPRLLYPILAFGVLCIASSSVMIRLISDEANGLTVATYRTFLATLFLLPFFPRAWPEIRVLSPNHKRLVLLSGVLLGLHFVTWISSLYYTTVASSTVLVNTSPLFIAMASFFILGERLHNRLLIGIILGFLGASLMAFGDLSDKQFPHAAFGNGLAILGMITVSGYMMAGRVVRQNGLSWLGYVFPVYFIAAVTVLISSLLLQTNLVVSWTVLGICALMALGPQIAGHGAMNYAVRYIPPAFVTLVILVEPVLSSLMTFLLWGEKPSTLSLFGMVVVLTGLIAALQGKAQMETND